MVITLAQRLKYKEGCGRWARLLRCDLEIGVGCVLFT